MSDALDTTFQHVFQQHYLKLLNYAARLVGDEEAEDVVQDVFVELWRRRDTVVMGNQILAFLYRSVHSKAMNWLKHQAVANNYSAAMLQVYACKLQYYQPEHSEVLQRLESQELRSEIQQAIQELPEKRREVFCLSCLQGRKNKEIAEALGISLRTVESHMYQALKFLRERLKHWMRLGALFVAKALSVWCHWMVF